MSGISLKKHRRGHDFGNLNLENVGSIQVNQDASNADDLVRKSQVESIAQDKAEGNLVSLSANASATTAFTSQSMVNLLATKQDNMSIHSSSTAFLEIVNGVEVKVKQLLSQSVNVDTTEVSLAAWLAANPSNGLEEGDMLILQGATINQERSWIHNGGSAGDVTDFTKLVTDYNETVIRGMFSSGDTFLVYDAPTGKFTVNFGTTSTTLGAQTLPVDNSEFTTVSGTTVLTVLKALEAYVQQVDNNASGGATTIDTRLSSLSGVSGNNLGVFNDSAFPENATIKQVLEASLVKHLFADNDRAAIRAVNATDKANLESSIDSEVVRATGAELAESNTRAAADVALQNAINANSSLIIGEQTSRAQGDALASQRLAVIEGDSNTAGSILKASSDLESSLMMTIINESVARQSADTALDTKISNLAEGDITFVGVIEANTSVSIRAERIAAGDTRNGQFITNIDLKAGETFVIGDDTDLGLSDATGGIVSYEKGDKLMITQDVAAGGLLEAHINAVPANQTGLARQNVTGSSTIHLDNNDNLDIKDDSVTVDHLQNSLLADINDKRSLTSNNTITSDSDTHIVTDATTGAAQNVHFKRTSNTSDALTGTKRAILGELMVSSNGSADAANPNFAHTATYATHYNGSSIDMSMSVGGVNSEAVVNNTNAAVYATGQYSLAISSHLGINSGVTGIAQNAGLSNIGVTGFGKAGGAGNDRGGVFTLSDSEFEAYSTFRGSNPIPYSDVALIADAGTSTGGKAFVAVGDSVFDGTITVPSAVNNTDAVNLGDVKANNFYQTYTIPAAGEVTVNHGLNSVKIIVQVWHGNELITSTLDIDEKTSNSFKVKNGSIDSLGGVEVCVMKLI